MKEFNSMLFDALKKAHDKPKYRYDWKEKEWNQVYLLVTHKPNKHYAGKGELLND